MMAEPLRITWEEIKVWSTQEMEVFVAPAETKKVIAFTYSYKDYPPRTRWVDKDKYFKPHVLELIKQDVKELIKGPTLPP